MTLHNTTNIQSGNFELVFSNSLKSALNINFPEKISSASEFNSLCKILISALKTSGQKQGPNTKFAELSAQISENGANIIQTPWGGVVIKIHEHPHVEKYLVVNAGKYLAFEKHEKKVEQIEVQEGRGIIIYRKTPASPLIVGFIKPGSKLNFPPGHEHCIIAIEPLVAYEISEDYKGMDQDLIFIYLPE
jgi:mannose-6-phosphate isomerase-like protein (cupin superfamily)